MAVTSTSASAAGDVSATPDSAATFNGPVRAIAYSGRTVYVGGEFTAALAEGRSHPRARLAAIDADTGALLAWAPSADAAVRGLAVHSGAVYTVGQFTTINGVRRDSVAKVDGVTGDVAPFRHSLFGQPLAVGVGHDRLYIGGLFSTVDGQPRQRLAAFSLATGELDAGWLPGADDRVEALAVTGDRVYAGGRFKALNGVSGATRLAAVHPVTGVHDPGFAVNVPVVVHAIHAGAGAVYAALGGQGGRLIAYSNGGVLQWTVTADGDVQAVTAVGDTVYLGGHFDKVCRSARTGDRGACLDGSDPRIKLASVNAADGRLSPWAPQANGIEGVYALAVRAESGSVAAGGTFTAIGGVTRKRFAQFS